MNKNASTLRKSDVDSIWEKDHKPILSAEQPKLLVDQASTSKIDGLTVCAQLGVCLCQKPEVAQFCNKLIAHMKPLFNMISKNVPSENRSLLEAGYIVAGFAKDGEVDKFFFHIGYINFQRWHFTGIRLYKRRFNAQDHTLLLSVGDPQSQDDYDPEAWMNEVSTIFAFVKQVLDLAERWHLHFYSILLDDAVKVVPFDEMPSRFVDVRSLMEPVLLWKGLAVETAKPKRNNSLFKRGTSRTHLPLNSSAPRPSKKAKAKAMADRQSHAVHSHGAADGLHSKRDEDGVDYLAMLMDEDLNEIEACNADAEQPPDPEQELAEFVEDELAVSDNRDHPEGTNAAERDDDHDDSNFDSGLDDVIVPEELAAQETHGEWDFLMEDDVLQGMPQESLVPRKERAEETTGRAPRQHEPMIIVPGLGELRFSERGNFLRAVCGWHGPECKRQRQATRGRKRGSGRPVGALIAWLRAGAACKDQLHHVCEATATFDQRKAARDWFCSTSPAANAFCERHESRHDRTLDGPDLEPRVMT